MAARLILIDYFSVPPRLIAKRGVQYIRKEMRYISILTFLILFSYDNSIVYEKFDSIQTNHIDTLTQDSIKRIFKVVDIGSTSEFLGGLNPKYPIERVFLNCGEWCEKDWENKGMFCGCRSYVVIKDDKPMLIRSKEELKEIFKPVDSYQEALSYAIVMTGNFPVFNADFFQEKFTYFIADPKPTNVRENYDGYYVTLFNYKHFGCGEHPYYLVTYSVTKDGQVKETNRKKAFKDPDEDSLCRD